MTLQEKYRKFVPKSIDFGEIEEGKELSFEIPINPNGLDGNIEDHIHFITGTCTCTSVVYDGRTKTIKGVIRTSNDLRGGKEPQDKSVNILVHTCPDVAHKPRTLQRNVLSYEDRPEKPIKSVELKYKVVPVKESNSPKVVWDEEPPVSSVSNTVQGVRSQTGVFENATVVR